MKQSVAILGGAFDPIHLGHLGLAEDTLAELDLDGVWFVPAAQSPLKDEPPVLDEAGRLDLLRAALADSPKFKICRTELQRGGMSYTIDTVRELQGRYPTVEFSWIIGADQVRQLDRWHEITELAQRVRFIVAARPGVEMALPDAEIPGLRLQRISSRPFDISSSDIRLRLAQEEAVNHLLPKPVTKLIMERSYYLKKI